MSGVCGVGAGVWSVWGRNYVILGAHTLVLGITLFR